MMLLLFSLSAWGWFNEHGLASTIGGVLIAGSLLGSWRWQLTAKQFYRLGDFVTLSFALVLVYLLIVGTEKRLVFIILEWLPIFFIPILLTQIYSTYQTLPLGTLFYSQRKREEVSDIDFKPMFVAICWLSSGATSDTGLSYFIVSILGFCALLWTVRSKNSPIILWFGVIVLAVILSYWGQQGLRQLQRALEEQAISWLTDWHNDPFKSTTSIGDIGELKLSDKIEFRVTAEAPLLLMQASYDRYLGRSWLATQRIFSQQTRYSERASQTKIRQLHVVQALKPTTILALPLGTVDISGLSGAVLQHSPMGAVKLTDAPDFVDYKIHYSGRQEGQVYEFDLQVPEQHKVWIRHIQQALKVTGQPAAVIAKAIQHYFQNNYHYSLFLGKELNPDKALIDFILNRKAGHCEYFAVASVFLLRSYGIPARLANGYAMQEYSAAEEKYIVRRRHAHAWAIAKIGSFWQAVDATPAQWLGMEEEQADLLQPLYDFVSRYYFKYKYWRYQKALTEDQTFEKQLGFSLVVLLLIILIGRLIKSRRALVRMGKGQEEKETFEYSGQDSSFFLIEKALEKTEDARQQHESAVAWVKRINDPDLLDISEMHYQYRFHGEQFTQRDKAQLKQKVSEWLLAYVS